MKHQKENICKFVEPKIPEAITTTNFVYETNPDILNKTQLRSKNTIYLVISGSGTYTIGNKAYALTSGNIFFSFSGVYFKIEGSDDLSFMYITFDGDRAENLFKRFSISPVNCLFEGNEGLVSFWQNSLARASEKNLDLISESVLLYSFSQLAPPEKNANQKLIDTIFSYVDSNFTNFSLTLALMAKELGYSAKYISKLFKDNTGMTFSEYLKHTRIKHAIFLMEQGITSVKNISLLSGYKDPLYFSNVFKKEIGISASEYIKQKGNVN